MNVKEAGVGPFFIISGTRSFTRLKCIKIHVTFIYSAISIVGTLAKDKIYV